MKNVQKIGIAVLMFAVIFYIIKNKNDDDKIDYIIKCAQLYELKKEKYFGGDIGQNKVIYSKDLNTCLVVNIYNDTAKERFWAMVIDMSNDKTLLYYSTEKGELKDKEHGWTLDDMLSEVRKFGFEVN